MSLWSGRRNRKTSNFEISSLFHPSFLYFSFPIFPQPKFIELLYSYYEILVLDRRVNQFLPSSRKFTLTLPKNHFLLQTFFFIIKIVESYKKASY